MIAGRYLLSILLFICGHIYSQDIDGLIAYYPFSGNANDVTGNNHNGIVIMTEQNISASVQTRHCSH
jgi:hypothetical protein